MLDSSWGEFFRPLRPHAKVFVWNSVACAVAGLLLALVLPKAYTARATILPPSEEQTGLSMSSLLRGITIPGVRVPLNITPSDMVQSVLDSDRVRAAIGRKLDPRVIYGIRDSADAMDRLRKQTTVRVTSLGVVEISVTAPGSESSARLANAYVDELDRFTRTQRMSRGHRARVFIERRLADVRVRLDSLMHEMSGFQSRSHAPAMSPTLNSSVETAARLSADRMNMEFQLDLARSYAAENSEEVRGYLARIEALDKELDRLPSLGMETARLLRDLKAHEQTFAFLTAQYEDARIEEARDVMSIEVLDPATPPRKPSFPRKRFFVLGGLTIGILGSLAWALSNPGGERPRGAPNA